MFESAFYPSAYSLIADYYHPSIRTVANAAMNCGIYLGVGLSSMTLELIGAKGWRFAYSTIGILGIAAGIIAIFVIKEP